MSAFVWIVRLWDIDIKSFYIFCVRMFQLLRLWIVGFAASCFGMNSSLVEVFSLDSEVILKFSQFLVCYFTHFQLCQIDEGIFLNFRYWIIFPYKLNGSFFNSCSSFQLICVKFLTESKLSHKSFSMCVSERLLGSMKRQIIE